MRAALLLPLVLSLGSSIAFAGDGVAAPPLEAVLQKARQAGKPILLDLSAVWCPSCKVLNKELETAEAKAALEPFVFQTYDGERGNGIAVVTRYKLESYPTLIVIDAVGRELERRIGFGRETLLPWLKEAAARASLGDAELDARLRKRPSDLVLLWMKARRAMGQGDHKIALRLLDRIEKADRSEPQRDAAEAAWQTLSIHLADEVRGRIRSLALDHLRRHPASTHGDQAAAMLAAAGATRAQIEESFAKVMAQGKGSELNVAVYRALGAGALDAALVGARKQIAETPDEPGAYDTLAEVHNYRGERAQAIETQRKGLALPKIEPDLSLEMKRNLARFEAGGRSPDVKPPTLGPVLTPRTAQATFADPQAVAIRLFDHELSPVQKACGSKAGSLAEAYVRVKVGARPHAEKVEVLEPSASPQLRQCLERAIGSIAIPADSKSATVVIRVPLVE